MNLLTALEIQGNGDNIKCDAGGPAKDSGKYVGGITLWRNGELHKELLSTNPVFDTAVLATEYMENIVKTVREMNLEDPLAIIDNQKIHSTKKSE